MSRHIKKINFSYILQDSSLSRLEIKILISFLTKKPREFFLIHPETVISQAIYKKFQFLKAKRLKNWPIAYLTGHKEFYGLDFAVNPSVLVPRPETEMIVEEIIDLVKKLASAKTLTLNADQRRLHGQHPLIIDLGTGSGAIIIAVAHELKRLFPAYYKTAKFSAGDISVGALKTASYNTKIHGLDKKIKFYRGNLLTPLKLTNQSSENKVNRDLIIAANLPYLTPTQIKNSPSISREPKSALAGGQDGLKYYRAFFQQLRNVKFRSATVLCEIDPGQAKKIVILATKYFPGAKNRLLPDLSGQNRLFITKIRP